MFFGKMLKGCCKIKKFAAAFAFGMEKTAEDAAFHLPVI